jgi:collagen type VII alpha
MSRPRRITELELTLNPAISDLIPLARPGSNSRVTLGTVFNSGFPTTLGDTTINGDLDVNGNLRVSTIVSSSILYDSGSTIFGNTLDDTHNFIGDVFISGSLFISGATEFGGDGSSGTSGINGTSGSSGINGTAGSGGTSGTSGFSIDSGSFATTGSNIFNGNQTISGSLIISSSNTFTNIGPASFIGNVATTGSLNVSGSTTQIGNNTLIGRTELSGSLFISGSTEFGGDLVPKEARGATLGTLERPFRDIFLQSASINIASDIPGGRGASISNTDGNVTIQAAGFQLKSGSFISFEVSETARTQIRVPLIPAGDIGAFSIIGNTSGSYQPVTNTGGMIHITGNDGASARITNDAFGTGSVAAFVGRAARGTANSPLNLKSGDVITRLSGIGWGYNGFSAAGGLATTAIELTAGEDFDTQKIGTKTNFYNAPIGGYVRTLSATLDTSGLFVSGAFTSSLSQGYIWVGGNGNVTRLVPTASFASTGSNVFNGTQTITGSLNITGSVDISGSITQIGDYTQLGNHTLNGHQTITGSLDVMGNINVASGSGFFYEGNKLFNRGQFYHTATLSGSANTAYPFQYNTTDTTVTNGTIYVENNSRVYVKHTGIYNIQFSSQLRAVTNDPINFSVWFAMTGSNVMNSNTDYTIEKVTGGGNMVAALNYLMPLSSGSYFEIYYSKTRTDGQIEAKGVQSTPTRPATPSVILTVTQIA